MDQRLCPCAGDRPAPDTGAVEMTWIRTVSEKQGKGFVKRVYDAKRKELGFIPPRISQITQVEPG